MYTMSQEGNALVYRWDGEVLSVEPWGANSFRVRSTVLGELEDTDYALLPQEPMKAEIKVEEYRGVITNGKITAVLEVSGWSKKCDISFYNQNGKLLLKEAGEGGALNKRNRFFKPIIGGDFHLTVTFASEPAEKLFGMGQYQQDILNVKNCNLEPGLQEFPGERSLCPFRSGLWLPLAQPGGRPRELRFQHHGMVCRKHQTDGLLDHGRRYSG